MPKAVSVRRTATLPNRIHALAAEMRSTALANWRRWSQTIADGGDAPAARDVLEAAQILKIDNPASQLQADANALTELASIDRAAAICRRTVVEKLAQYGGSIDEIESRLAAAKAEVVRLAEDLEAISSGCSESYWTTARHQLQRRHGFLWPELQPVREKLEYFGEEEIAR